LRRKLKLTRGKQTNLEHLGAERRPSGAGGLVAMDDPDASRRQQSSDQFAREVYGFVHRQRRHEGRVDRSGASALHSGEMTFDFASRFGVMPADPNATANGQRRPTNRR
jgi:hypothetical protein